MSVKTISYLCIHSLYQADVHDLFTSPVAMDSTLAVLVETWEVSVNISKNQEHNRWVCEGEKDKSRHKAGEVYNKAYNDYDDVTTNTTRLK